MIGPASIINKGPRPSTLHYVSCYNTFPLYLALIKQNMIEIFKILPTPFYNKDRHDYREWWIGVHNM